MPTKLPTKLTKPRSSLPYDQVSTKTIIISTNLILDTEYLFQHLPVVSLQIPSNLKKKEKIIEFICSQPLKDGDIIFMEYANYTKGQYVPKKSKKKFFRNSITIIMYINGKCINFKLPNQGRIQMTGCKEDKHAELVIFKIWEYIQQLPLSYTLKLSENDKQLDKTLSIVFRTVMTNINFKLGFSINRQLLDMYINQYTPFNSLLESSFGYTGVNIKVPYTLEYEQTIPTLTCVNNEWIRGNITQDEYIRTLTEKEQKKERNKKRNNTFLIFYSGVAIMSGMCPYYMEDTWDQFIKTINDARQMIEESN